MKRQINFKALVVKTSLAPILSVLLTSTPGECTTIAEVVIQSAEKKFELPDDPAQSIRYWKPQVISPEQDVKVAVAHDVFDRLLRTWDLTRVEPQLNVVSSTSGPWAASLADGNILLSRSAIDVCYRFGKGLEKDLLAFVLSHELSHQKSSDLWHLKFFRMIGSQKISGQTEFAKKLDLKSMGVEQLEDAEAQADHDAIVTMASVGFDPYRVLNKQVRDEKEKYEQKDFYKFWLESIWKGSCLDQAENNACEKAKNRALRTQAQLQAVAQQGVLYELGVQSMVAGRFGAARAYFKAYGHNFPSRAVHSSIGLSYLAEALNVLNESRHSPKRYFPLFLDASAGWDDFNDHLEDTRGQASALSENARKKRVKELAKEAKNYFDKAHRLAPEHQLTLFHLAMSYILLENSAMAKGVLQGQYQSLYGEDLASELLLVLSSSMDQEYDKTIIGLKKLLPLGRTGGQNEKDLSLREKTKQGLPENLLRDQVTYAIYFNLASHLDFEKEKIEAQTVWKTYAKEMARQGKGMMFQIAVMNLEVEGKGDMLSRNRLTSAPLISGLRLGDEYRSYLPTSQTTKGNKDDEISPSVKHAFLLEGEPNQYLRFDDGVNLVLGEDQKVKGLWYSGANIQSPITRPMLAKLGAYPLEVAGIKLGDSFDRPLKALGVPSRKMDLLKGQYLAYDQYGLAFLVREDRISGWFLY